jgi:endogenous inhibitor of DNA gyrase (YacG/DUF329 family)
MLLPSLMSLLQWPFDFFSDFFRLTFIMMIIGVVSFLVFFGIIVIIICRASKASRQQARIMYEVPNVPAKPERHIIRETLPTKCPECLAPISYEKVNWVGPRQAQCPYCGHVVELQEQETIESQ